MENAKNMITNLVEEAISARSKAYSPYSNFQVGAALLAKSGKVYHGCNIENAALTPGICAERTAFATAVYEGEREFEAIAVSGTTKAFPCGVCRQVMREFCDPDGFKIIVADGTEAVDGYTSHTLAELLPHSFGPEAFNT